MLYLHDPPRVGVALLRAANPGRWLRGFRWRREQLRLIRRSWYDPTARCDDRAVFIGGCLRSGTTLLREILHRHPNLSCSLETSMLAPPFDVSRIASYYQLERKAVLDLVDGSKNLVDFAHRFYTGIAAKEGKQRWVDKAARYVRAVERLLTWFPRGRFIHVVRDGRDVACSMRHHPSEVVVEGAVVSQSVTRPIGECGGVWLAEASAGRAFHDHPRSLEVRYERLVSDPTAQVERVCRFIGEKFHVSMLKADGRIPAEAAPARFLTNAIAAGPVTRASVGRWTRELSKNERVKFDDAAGELLIALGYESNHDWVDVQSLRQDAGGGVGISSPDAHRSST